MSLLSLLRQHWLPFVLALGGGLLTTLSFSPFFYWPLGIVAVALLTFALKDLHGRAALLAVFLFGIGLYASGASWVYVSIKVFGQASAGFAVLLVGLFVLLLATVFTLPFYIFSRWLWRERLGLILGVPALWVIGEWVRTWLFTGFPWLFLGYGHVSTALAGWAPVLGVMGLSFAAALTGSAIAFFIIERKQLAQKRIAIGAVLASVALIWFAGALLKNVSWTQEFSSARFGSTISVGIAQGNIPQERKWDVDFIGPTYERYFALTKELFGNEWIVWPEAAVPQVYHDAKPMLDEVNEAALKNNAALITGVLYDSLTEYRFYNSITGLGLASGIYHKQRLVPFGDYVPLREWFGPVLDLFGLPVSIIYPGPPNQRGLQVDNAFVAPSVCYEVVYPDLVAQLANSSHILLTVSNDAWFGSSIGPLQHLQMAQMRALETQRYLIRATNNGVSALVNDKGQILAESERFVMQTLTGEVQLRQGRTPFMVLGSEPIVFICMLIVAALLYFTVRRAKY